MPLPNKEINLKQQVIRNKYSPQFKDQVLARTEKEGVPQIARDLSLAESLICSWKAKQKQGGNSLEIQKLQQAELSRLKRESARTIEEIYAL